MREQWLGEMGMAKDCANNNRTPSEHAAMARAKICADNNCTLSELDKMGIAKACENNNCTLSELSEMGMGKSHDPEKLKEFHYQRTGSTFNMLLNPGNVVTLS